MEDSTFHIYFPNNPLVSLDLGSSKETMMVLFYLLVLILIDEGNFNFAKDGLAVTGSFVILLGEGS